MTLMVEATFAGGVLVPKTPLALSEGDQVRLVVQKDAATATFRAEDLPRLAVPWPFVEGESFRREDLYGDDGR